MRVAIVTGGSNGIGRATALELGRRGVGVILTYRSHRERAEAVVAEIEAGGRARAVALALDLKQVSGSDEFARAARASLQAVWNRTTFDYLVNNGGIGGGMPFADMTEAYFNNLLDTNFRGPVFLTQQLLRFMEDGGRIVNVSSSSSGRAFPGYSVYGSLKAAMTSWTRYLANELAPRQIRVNAVSPGPTHTNIGDGAFDQHPEYIEPLAKQTALGRIGMPEDIGRVIVTLLSDDLGWVTAQDIEVSGGHLL